MKKIFVILNKEILQGLRNWVLLILIVLPIVVTIVMGFMFTEQFSLTMIIPEDVEQDEAILQRTVEISEEMIQIRRVENFEQAKNLVDGGDAPIAVSLPQNSAGDIQVYYVENQSMGKIALSILQNAIYEQHVGDGIEFDIQGISIETDSLNYLAGILVFAIIFIAVSHSVTMISAEKDKQTLDYLLTTPVGYHQIILGKIIFVTLMTLFSVIMTVSMGILLGIVTEISSIIVSLIYTVLITFAFAGLGLIISGLCKNLQEATSYSIIVMMPLAFFAMIPDGGGVLKIIKAVLPSSYAKDMLSGALNGQWPGWISFVYIVVFNILMLTIASMVLKNSYND